MKILVTGSKGFFGSIIYKHFESKYILFGLSRSGSTFDIDLQNKIPVFTEIFEIVIHAAGKAHSYPNNLLETKYYFDINLGGTKNLLLGLEKSGLPKRFVFISSVSVYGLEMGVQIDEKHPLLAIDPYGLSKIQAEHLVLDWCQKNNVLCTILRLPLLVGENPPGNLGVMLNGIKKGYYFNIAGGLARKSMVLAEDVANVLIKASEIGGIYNLTDGYHPSFYELSNAIAKNNGKKRIFNMHFLIAKSIALIGDFVSTKFPLNSSKLNKITTDLTFDDSKARHILGWNPEKVLDYYSR